MNNKRALVSVALLTALIVLVGFQAIPVWLSAAAPFAIGGLFFGTGLMVTSTSNRFQDTPCRVVVSNNFDTHGTITRASVSHLTPAQLETLFRPSGLFADMDAWFRTSFEMQACGTRTNGMYDWLMSSAANVKGALTTTKIMRGPSLLHPFILARQDSVINTDYWAITNGWQNNAYTAGVTGPLTAPDLALGATTDRVIRVVSRYGIDLDPKWFLNRDRVHIFNRVAGKAARGQWKVLASEVATDLSYVDVLVTTENAGSSSTYDATPTGGVLLPGGNNVNDYESWCNNRPTLDPRKRVPFWYQTMRRTRQVDSEYKEVFARLLESNDYFKAFGDLPLSERNRQDEELFQKRWVNSFFWGKPISANQTLANWQSLEAINTAAGDVLDPGTSGKIIAYRANMIGVYEQLKACGRVLDLLNNPLNFYEWLDENYRIMRARRSQGKAADSIDWFTDSSYMAMIETAFINYYKAEYGDIVRINIETGSNELGFRWKTFTVKYPAGVKINLVTHEFFDDMVNAFDNENIGIKSSGRFLMALEIGKGGPRGGTIYPGIVATNKKMRTLGEIENLGRLDTTFACVMENVTSEVSLISETCTAVVECPANNLIIEGIGEAVPVTTGKVANPDYVNLY